LSDIRQAILDARAAMNEAIGRCDPAAIGALLLPNYHVVTVRSVQYNGREESVRSWAALFDRDHGATHAAVPEEIHVNEPWGMAEEHGRWNVTINTRDGPMALAGVYAAKWQNTAEGWLLQAEIFTPVTVERS
jgi:ketosteroid isomerase-like protein